MEKRRYRTRDERRAIVEETLRPEISVAEVARAHQVSANQLSVWRRHYREGRLGQKASSMLPVRILQDLLVTSTRGVATSRQGSIEILFESLIVRIEGAADPECVRALVEGLRR